MKKIAPFLIWLIGTLLGKTWRTRVVSPPSVSPFDPDSPPRVYCFWHSSLLVVAYTFRRTNKTAIVSRSRDGRLAADAAGRWGHAIIFGSSSRGGAHAVRESVRVIREEGRCVVLTPDGPRGPREVVKPGAAQIAIASGAPAVSVRVDVKGAWRLRSWDRFIIPLPFAKITITLGEPIAPPAGVGEDEAVIAVTKKIQEELAV